ncbi:TetR/AcrR family transcriptional regulator [Oceanobacillus jeddahense]|uniref:TetR/AcrR family transcriptional regulator n=1 Tax=Oceanobacillus jeddahense TaxID=1462527 RepID=UPI000595A6D8|nr:TetR/AcrR family transcriptional regulator [Oceanobacillus jeddahense]
MDRRIRKSKKALRDALIDLLDKKEFKQISITDIVKNADVNRGTFYKYYTYKEDLIKEVQDMIIQDLKEAYKLPYQGLIYYKQAEITKRNETSLFDHIYKYRKFYHLVLNSTDLYAFQQIFVETISNIHMNDLLYYMEHPKIEKKLFSIYQCYGIFGLLVEWDKDNFSASPEYITKQHNEILLFDHPSLKFKINYNDNE